MEFVLSPSKSWSFFHVLPSSSQAGTDTFVREGLLRERKAATIESGASASLVIFCDDLDIFRRFLRFPGQGAPMRDSSTANSFSGKARSFSHRRFPVYSSLPLGIRVNLSADGNSCCHYDPVRRFILREHNFFHELSNGVLFRGIMRVRIHYTYDPLRAARVFLSYRS